MRDPYNVDIAVPDQIGGVKVYGPSGIALVRAWDDGRTDPGWGLRGADDKPGFMENYRTDAFNARRVVFGYNKGKWNFAFVMRSLRLVCIDIDGKNGGLDGALRLGMLPYTLAEISKSGDGYHLFYATDEPWDPDTGFARFGDRIGIEQGVDIRATGCVYHHPQQRWNSRPVTALPDHLAQLLTNRQQKIAATNARIVSVLESDDPMEALMMQDELVSELKKPIPQGKRNNTLFAIGSQMEAAQVPDWDTLLEDRASDLGLDDEEISKLVANIRKYGTQATP